MSDGLTSPGEGNRSKTVVGTWDRPETAGLLRGRSSAPSVVTPKYLFLVGRVLLNTIGSDYSLPKNQLIFQVRCE